MQVLFDEQWDAEWRQRIFNLATENLKPKFLLVMLNTVFESLKSATKLNVPFGFVLTNVDVWSCHTYYAQEKNILLKGSKFVATTEDLTKIKNLLSNTNVTKPCTRKWASTNSNFNKMTNNTNFAALLKELPTGCEDAVLPDPVMKNFSVRCVKFEESSRKLYNFNLCFLRALVFHLHLIKIPKKVNSFLIKLMELMLQVLELIFMVHAAALENIVQLDFFLYDIDIVDGSMIGEFSRRSVGKYSNTVPLLRYNSNICYVSSIIAFFKAYLCLSYDHFIKTSHELELRLSTCKKNS